MKILFLFLSIFTISFFSYSGKVLGANLSNTGSQVSSNSKTASQHSLVHLLNSRIRNQRKLTQEGLKSGKLTQDQAKGIWLNIKAAKVQEISYFKQNHSHELISDQRNQLNSILDKNSALLGETQSSN